ncbi:hypothetical protein MKW94_022632 [Papaver nudicaule]|uniref:J domain-containing protein n=1 Tax=Papaver nudicaule TaxID=74823 RepID=A0AA41V5H7_PAPNU|nr:hypothetical protein [Papaver nudicaule]
MSSKDYVGARTMVIKAQKLYPSRDNYSQMLTVCEVHCSAERKVVGSDPDWYGILQIEQTADEASIKKQIRKLALQIHPDKNKFPGAEAAFISIGEAQKRTVLKLEAAATWKKMMISKLRYSHIIPAKT